MANAQLIPIGSGSYTETFPGVGKRLIMKLQQILWDVQVTDGQLTDNAIITVRLNDINESGLGLMQKSVLPKVYPNPLTDILNIEWPLLVSTEIYDLTGRFVMTSEGNKLHLSSLPEGVYIIILSGSDSVKVHLKIVKE